MIRQRVPVLIVGAGYAGLSAATLLAWRGVQCMLVERRESTSRLPKAHGLNRRSMEVLRVVEGLEEALHSASSAPANDSTLIIAERVVGPAIATLVTKNALDSTLVSPAKVCTAGQDRVEPVLLRYAEEHGADINFSTTLVEFRAMSEGVEAVLRDERTGAERIVFADYLIAADGAEGAIREVAGVKMDGPGVLAHTVSILFEADLASLLPSRGLVLYYLRHPSFSGSIVTCDDPNLFQLNVEYNPAFDKASDFDLDRCAQFVRDAVGLSDLEFEIRDIWPWKMSALMADRMSFGRVLLAGDCAHVMPPVGGLGGQTAIQDAADLAWKLALVIKGHAAPTLVETYEPERRPVARIAIARQIANYVERLLPDRQELRIPADEYDMLSTSIGYRYRSSAIISEQDDSGKAVENPLEASGAPGTRLPHVWLVRGGERLSSHDLIGRHFVLFAGPEGKCWAEAAEEISKSDPPLSCYRLSSDIADPSDQFLSRLGLSSSGAALVRPDGYIAWRSREGQRQALSVLEGAFARVRGMRSMTQSHQAEAESLFETGL
ncbi:methanobactin biosynthesis FAD monooxygenase MbnF [Methylocystis iwaonis]|uniref:methanobactin biosynthesis FAD monooxygenase MbnF n=1 Tax=Methylocystis iwaonis TaxID=2885079 RepID=UPI002E7AD115|nr:methanobactin biosynthesis FAD monooxygenase MbnF [Methylocystis iwaonis]